MIANAKNGIVVFDEKMEANNFRGDIEVYSSRDGEGGKKLSKIY